MQNNTKMILSMVFVILAFSITISIGVFANAQTVTTSKIFEKSNNVTLDTFTYNNGEIISYDRVNYIPEQIIIHKWNEISILDQQLITSQLVSLGYTEKEEFNPEEITSSMEVNK